MNSPDQDFGNPHENSTPPGYLDNDSKRRKPAANGRGVNTLSKEALDKKRDNDRKAQAAIRKRQKDEVARLKQEIDLLRARKPDLEVIRLEEEKKTLLDENERLRTALNTIMDTIRPFVVPSMQDLAAAAHHSAQVAALNPNPHNSSQISIATNNGSYPSSNSLHSTSLHSSDRDLPSQSTTLPYRRLDLEDQSERIQRHHQLNQHESLDFSKLFTIAKKYPSLPPQNRSAPSSLVGDLQPHQQPWSMLPPITAPNTKYEKILADFINDHRQASGSPKATASIYPVNPSISILLNPIESTASSGSRSPDMARHMRDATLPDVSPAPDPLSTYMTKLLSFFDDLIGLPEKVAVTFFMYSVLRWLTYPTKENYELLPEIMRPRGSQLSVRHPAWFDTLPWPEMRERMCSSNHGDFTFGSRWYDTFTPGLSVNWPFSESTCLSKTGKDGQEEISPAFLEHISRLDSWTLDSRFFNTFPMLLGTARVKDKTNDAIYAYPLDERVNQGPNPVTMNADFSRRGRQGYEHPRHGNAGGRHNSFG